METPLQKVAMVPVADLRGGTPGHVPPSPNGYEYMCVHTCINICTVCVCTCYIYI